MQMTGGQVLTAAIALVLPISALIYSNSRVSDLRADLGNRMNDLRTDLGRQLEELRKSLDKIDARLDKMDARLDKIDTHVKLLTGKVYEMMGDR